MSDTTEKKPKVTGLALLREPFPAHQIGKLPKPTKQQTEEVAANFRAGVRCDVCGGWHHPKVVHLDYVGHAPLTDRLLDTDPNWTWEPPTTDELSRLPPAGTGMWIKLTVCGVTRYGYGHADGKKGGDAIKEMIGDALRNAAMRFGCALELWHKGELHVEEDTAPPTVPPPTPERDTPKTKGRSTGLGAPTVTPPPPQGMSEIDFDEACTAIADATTFQDLRTVYTGAYRQASPEQQAVLQVAYEGAKAKNNWNVPAQAKS